MCVYMKEGKTSRFDKSPYVPAAFWGTVDTYEPDVCEKTGGYCCGPDYPEACPIQDELAIACPSCLEMDRKELLRKNGMGIYHCERGHTFSGMDEIKDAAGIELGCLKEEMRECMAKIRLLERIMA